MRKMIIVLVLAFLLIPRTAKAETYIDFGLCKITYYCPCEICSGGYGRRTATKTCAEAGRTIAVDPDIIPLHSKVKIGKHIYIAEDVGGGVVGDHVDIFVDTHEETLEGGVKQRQVWVVKD